MELKRRVELCRGSLILSKKLGVIYGEAADEVGAQPCRRGPINYPDSKELGLWGAGGDRRKPREARPIFDDF